MNNLYRPNVSTSVVDNLVSGTLIPSKVLPVKVVGTGIVRSGNLLTSTDGENFEVYDPDDTDSDIQAVLLVDADADDADESVQAAAFGGEFNQNVIEEVMGITLTAAAINAARVQNEIYIAPMNPAPETF